MCDMLDHEGLHADIRICITYLELNLGHHSICRTILLLYIAIGVIIIIIIMSIYIYNYNYYYYYFNLATIAKHKSQMQQ